MKTTMKKTKYHITMRDALDRYKSQKNPARALDFYLTNLRTEMDWHGIPTLVSFDQSGHHIFVACYTTDRTEPDVQEIIKLYGLEAV